MISIDEGILDFHEIHYHLRGRRQALVEYILHNVANFGLQFVKLDKLWQLDLDDNSSELLVTLVSAVKRWLQ